jgi:hypothetical protein
MTAFHLISFIYSYSILLIICQEHTEYNIIIILLIKFNNPLINDYYFRDSTVII